MGAEGWVKNYRKIKEWGWYKNPLMSHLFQHLIREANHADGEWMGITIKMGQIVTGLHSLSAATGISIRGLRTCLARLEQGGEIIKKSTNKFSIITICKYSEYQSTDEQCRQTNDKQTTSKRQANDNKQEGKEEKEEKEERKDIVGQGARPRPNGVPVAAIVEMLNAKAGTQFKPNADITKKHIKARWAEGFILDDFRTVIDHKVGEWGTDAKMREFLRPQTLFGTKFESYLQAAKMTPIENEWGIYGKWKDQPQHN